MRSEEACLTENHTVCGECITCNIRPCRDGKDHTPKGGTIMKEYLLEFKWTVSKGRDTYGYNICSLYVDGSKVSACNGGGDDMQGKALGNWIALTFEKELVGLTIPKSRRNGQDVQEYYGLTFHDPGFDPGKVKVDRAPVFGKDEDIGKTVDELEEEG